MGGVQNEIRRGNDNIREKGMLRTLKKLESEKYTGSEGIVVDFLKKGRRDQIKISWKTI